jgi:predicted DsbA family dithiol-disulfide isomerase
MTTATRLPVVVFGDFICPWSYITVDLVKQLAAEFDVVPIWRPHLLRPDIPPGGMAYPDPSRQEATIAWLQESAPEAAARMRYPTKLHYSVTAFEGLAYAQEMGRGFEYAAAVFDALWVDGDDIADTATLRQAAGRAGLDEAAFGAALHTQRYRELAMSAIVQARQLGVTATPTLILGQTRVNGWHYYEVLHSILAEQLAEPTADPTADSASA